MCRLQNVAVTVFLLTNAYSTLVLGSKSGNSQDIEINGSSVSVQPITIVNNNNYSSTTEPPPPNTTTASTTPITTTTTTTPVTTPKTTTTSTTPAPTSTTTSTTLKPNVTTTAKPVTTTEKPTLAPPTTPVPSHRRFDGPSFIGGIVLALGLVAIGFVAFKFYKARTELNYHTL